MKPANIWNVSRVFLNVSAPLAPTGLCSSLKCSPLILRRFWNHTGLEAALQFVFFIFLFRLHLENSSLPLPVLLPPLDSEEKKMGGCERVENTPHLFFIYIFFFETCCLSALGPNRNRNLGRRKIFRVRQDRQRTSNKLEITAPHIRGGDWEAEHISAD